MNAQAINMRAVATGEKMKGLISAGGLLYIGFLALIIVFALASPVFLTP